MLTTHKALQRSDRKVAVLLVSVSAFAFASSGVLAQTGLPAAPPPASNSPATTPGNPGSGARGSGNASSGTVPDADTIIVTGYRQSLANAQSIKRNSDTIVDAITAEDIGALPDRSVTEALQRVPGVSITHFAAVNDPDHISPEGQNVLIRGLPYVQSQFNGRDAFTANKGRAISFQDIAPDLLSSIEVYKNQTADQIEGGIAGNINLITRRPLDTNKDLFAFNFDFNYGDLAKKEAPDASIVVSHQWDTGAGRFGILASASYSQLFTRQDSSKVTSYLPRCVGPGCDPALANAQGNVGAPFAGLTPGRTYYIPTGGGISRQDFDRRRQGYSLAAQWESPSRDILATFQFLRTNTTQTWTEHTAAVVEDTAQGQIVPVAGSAAPTFDSNGILKTGTFTVQNGFRPRGVPAFGIQQQEISRGVSEGASTDDYGAHISWKASDRLKFDFDGQYTDSQSSDLDVGLYGSTWADEQFDLTGEFPRTTRLVPPGARYTSFADPAANFWRAAIDHEDNNKGHEYTGRVDGEFAFLPGSFLRKVKFGARYADRSQTVRSDGYNWGNLSEAWNGNNGPAYASDITPSGFGTYNFGNFLRGNSQGNQTIYGFIPNNALSYGEFIKGARAIQALVIANGGFQGWSPIGLRAPLCTGTTVTNCILTTAQGGDGFHNIGELSTNNEKTYAGYARIDFGKKDFGGGLGFDGNIGVRYVRTESSSKGSTQFPVPSSLTTGGGGAIAGGVLDCSKQPVVPPTYNLCSNTETQRAAFIAFANGSFLLNSRGQTYDDWLPSVNLRLLVRDKVQFRFAYSKAITRPSFNDLYNYTQLSVYTPNAPPGSTNLPIPGFRADARGNPLLRPTKSDNFDLTGEWYFSRVGSITLGGFYKRLTNIYSVSNGVTSGLPGAPVGTGQQGVGSNGPNGNGTISFTNNGVTQDVTFFGVNNNNTRVDVKGVEVSYQQVFSFLPGFLDGLGFNGNYTYIDAGKLPGQAVKFFGSPNNNGTLPFPGISKHNYNATLFYEKYGVQARASYTWRSHYLINSQDVNFPSAPVYSGSVGSLDASLFVDVGKHFKLGVEGTNLTDYTSKTYVQINSAGLQALRAAFKSDRTYRLSGRVVF